MTDEAPGTRVIRAGLPEPEQGAPFLPGPTFAAPYHLRGDPESADYVYGRYGNPTVHAYERALGELEDARPDTPLAAIVEPLVASLGDESASVRAMAASALARMKDPRAVEPLIGLLDDESELVRQTARSVLRGFDDPRADEAVDAARLS